MYGTLWTTNLLVPITSKWLGLNESLLVGAVTFRKDVGGTRTELELTPPGAFMASAQEMDQAAKPASGESKDTKQAWDAGSAGPGT